MRFIKSFIIIALLFTSTRLTAQTPWTLEQCIRYALENNIQIKQQQGVIEQNKNTLTQSKFSMLPNLNASAGYSMGWGRSLDPTTYQYVDGDRLDNSNISASSSVNLFGGLQKQNTVKRNDINLQAAIQDVEKLKNDISLNVAAAFLQVLLAKESVAIAEQQLLSTKEQVAKTQKLVDGGKLTLSNLLDLQSQQATNESLLVNAQNGLAIADLALKQLLELSADNNFSIEIPEITKLPEGFQDEGLQRIYDDALARLPEIQGAELRLESAKKVLDISRGAYYPSLNLSAGYGTAYSNTSYGGLPAKSYFDQITGNRNINLSLGLSFPIFNALQTRTQVKNAKINILNSELELQRTKNTLYKSIQQAQTDATGYLKSYQASVKNVNAIQEAFRYTEKKFDAGAVTSTDYIVAKNNLFKAQSDCVQAKYQYIFKTKILDFYKGLPITL